VSDIRIVTLPGQQVRQTKLEAWAQAEGVRIVRQIKLVGRSPLQVQVEVVPR
jgi:hypothetical protein